MSGSAESRRIGTIPALLWRPAGHASSEPAPLVFFVHGYGSRKEDGAGFGERLAAAGIAALSFDCWLHGERGDDGSTARRFEPVYPESCGLDHYVLMHEVAVQAARDIDMLIDALAAEGLGADGRIGVSGFSMGGFATYVTAATNPRVACVVAGGGRPTFARAWDDVTLGTSTYEEWAEPMARLEAETAARAAYMAEIDPFGALDRFCPRPLLMINGDRDVDQPYLYALELYRRLRPRYAAAGMPANLRLDMPPIAHEFGPEQMDLATAWLARHLG